MLFKNKANKICENIDVIAFRVKNVVVKTFTRKLFDEYLKILSAEIVTVPCIPEKLQNIFFLNTTFKLDQQ